MGAKGTAYISFQEKRDAQDAVKYKDSEKVGGNTVRVSLAGVRPPPNPRGAAPRREEIVTTEKSERDDKKDANHRNGRGSDRRRDASRSKSKQKGAKKDS